MSPHCIDLTIHTYIHIIYNIHIYIRVNLKIYLSSAFLVLCVYEDGIYVIEIRWIPLTKGSKAESVSVSWRHGAHAFQQTPPFQIHGELMPLNGPLGVSFQGSLLLTWINFNPSKDKLRGDEITYPFLNFNSWTAIVGPLLLTWINFNPSKISNYILGLLYSYIHYKLWDEITYPFLNFNSWTAIAGPPLLTWINFNPSKISNYILGLLYSYIHYKLRDEITYPFPNCNGCTVEVWEWISNYILRLLYSNLSYIHYKL